MNIDINNLIPVALAAGEKIMEIYNTDFDVEIKGDNSPLTQADKAGNTIIVEALQKLYPSIPIISEENKLTDYNIRKNWEFCWLVDPLDGTKEFIKKNGEFTVNIALIHRGNPIAGVVHVPAQNITYYAQLGLGCYKIQNGITSRLTLRPLAEDGILKIVGSRSHSTPELEDYVAEMQNNYDSVEFVATGSSLKFCILADGKADVYPRLGPTMEWDTAAGHIVAQEAGAEVLVFDTQLPLTYNREHLLNPYFIVKNPAL